MYLFVREQCTQKSYTQILMPFLGEMGNGLVQSIGFDFGCDQAHCLDGKVFKDRGWCLLLYSSFYPSDFFLYGALQYV